jgi:hypothetical protein
MYREVKRNSGLKTISIHPVAFGRPLNSYRLLTLGSAKRDKMSQNAVKMPFITLRLTIRCIARRLCKKCAENLAICSNFHSLGKLKISVCTVTHIPALKSQIIPQKAGKFLCKKNARAIFT